MQQPPTACRVWDEWISQFPVYEHYTFDWDFLKIHHVSHKKYKLQSIIKIHMLIFNICLSRVNVNEFISMSTKWDFLLKRPGNHEQEFLTAFNWEVFWVSEKKKRQNMSVFAFVVTTSPHYCWCWCFSNTIYGKNVVLWFSSKRVRWEYR